MKTLFLDSGQGLLPFIFAILKHNIKNDFIFYFDEINFPYGNKNILEVKKILFTHLNNFKKIKDLETVVIGCNTLSTLIDNNKKYPFKIITILEFNLKRMHKDDIYLGTDITTTYLNKHNIKAYSCKNLATLIEERRIREIICFLKNIDLKGNLLLGCTHYPLIKNLFKKYTNNKIVSFEDDFVKLFDRNEKLHLTFVTTKKSFYQKIFPTLSINYLSPTYFLIGEI